MTIAAQVWTYWIAFPLTIGTVAAVVATIAGYVKSVSGPRYPPKR